MLFLSLVSLVTDCLRDLTTNLTQHLPSLGLELPLHVDWSQPHLAVVPALQWVGTTWLLYASTTTLLALLLYWVAFTPLNRVRDMTEVGWGFLGGTKKTLPERIREVQRRRKKGNLPPVFPNGWFSVAESRSLAVGQVLSVQVLGETLAVFRGEDGQAHVTDAYCPHIGANLAVGGVVKGNCLECPFHGWLFRGSDGACVHIPYSSNVPKTAKVKHWESREMNGHVFVWRDAEGRAPLWELPEIKAITTGAWAFRGRTEHQILAHVQEIPENGADVAHLGHLHGPSVFKGSDLGSVFSNNKLLDVGKHHWHAQWQAREAPEEHIADATVSHNFTFFNDKFSLLTMKVPVEQIGPGVVHLYFSTWLGGRGVLVQTVTPVEPLRQRVVHHLYTSSTFVAPLAKFYLFAEALQFERDIMVWNNKQFLSQPLLVSEDRAIVRFRRWYNQFYSKNSPQFSFTSESLEW